MARIYRKCPIGGALIAVCLPPITLANQEQSSRDAMKMEHHFFFFLEATWLVIWHPNKADKNQLDMKWHCAFLVPLPLQSSDRVPVHMSSMSLVI